MTLLNGALLNAGSTAFPSTRTVNTVSPIGNLTVSPTDGVLLCDATAGGFTITFLPSALNVNQKVQIVKTDITANQIQISNGGAAIAALAIPANGSDCQAFNVQSTGVALVVT